MLARVQQDLEQSAIMTLGTEVYDRYDPVNQAMRFKK